MQILLQQNNVKWLGDMERYVYNTGNFMVEFDFIATILLRQVRQSLE